MAREIWEAALRLLARREYGAAELRQRLLRRGFLPEEVEKLLAELQEKGLQSDRRLVEGVTRRGLERGYGPLKVRDELRRRGVPDPLIDQVWQAIRPTWEEAGRQIYLRKFGPNPPSTVEERARRWRFLARRGFTAEQIASLLERRAAVWPPSGC